MNNTKDKQESFQGKRQKAFIIDTYNSRLDMLFRNLSLVVERIEDETSTASEDAVFNKHVVDSISDVCLPVLNLILMDMSQLLEESRNEVYEVIKG